MKDVEGYDAEKAERMLPYLKWALISMNIGRLIIIFIALFKSLKVSRVVIYYESLYMMVDAFLPMDVDMDRANLLMFYRMIDVLYSFFISSPVEGIAATLPQLAHLGSRAMILNDEIGKFDAIIGATSNIVSLLANTLAFKFILSWIGWRFIEARMSSTFYHTILGSMDSGVVIIKKDSLGIKFYNKAADNINLSLQGKRPPEEASIDSAVNFALSDIKSAVTPSFDLSCKNLATVNETLLYKPEIRS